MAGPKENVELLADTRETIGELVAVLELCRQTIPAAEETLANTPDPKALFYGCILGIVSRFTAANKKLSENEIPFYIDLLGSYGVAVDALADMPTPKVAEILYEIMSSVPELQEATRALMHVFQTFDNAFGTSHAEKMRTMFFRLANAIARADGRVTSREEAELASLKEMLWDSSTAKVSYEPAFEKSLHEDVKPILIPEARELDAILSEFSLLVGLNSVKRDVAALVNFLKVQQIRKAKGMSAVPLTLHMVFYGNPGTGKTTVARLLAEVYRSLKILSKGHLVETDRSGLVAGYVGQTAIKVKQMVEKAQGGMLFIDEAYSLHPQQGGDYGEEAVATLLKLMEDNREDLVVIVAGYTDKMGKFLASNPGLKSRFNKWLSFEDYVPGQLTAIFELFCKKSTYQISAEARAKLETIFEIAYENRDETFGNARLARNSFETAISNQASRIVSLPNVNMHVLSTI